MTHHQTTPANSASATAPAESRDFERLIREIATVLAEAGVSESEVRRRLAEPRTFFNEGALEAGVSEADRSEMAWGFFDGNYESHARYCAKCVASAISDDGDQYPEAVLQARETLSGAERAYFWSVEEAGQELDCESALAKFRACGRGCRCLTSKIALDPEIYFSDERKLVQSWLYDGETQVCTLRPVFPQQQDCE